MSLLQIVSRWIIKYFGMAARESGERHAYELTSDRSVPGSWRVDRLNEIVPDKQVLIDYRENGWDAKIWDFSIGVWQEALAKGVQS